MPPILLLPVARLEVVWVDISFWAASVVDYVVTCVSDLPMMSTAATTAAVDGREMITLAISIAVVATFVGVLCTRGLFGREKGVEDVKKLTVLVTGASSGIGLACVHALRERGDTVIALDIKDMPADTQKWRGVTRPPGKRDAASDTALGGSPALVTTGKRSGESAVGTTESGVHSDILFLQVDLSLPEATEAISQKLRRHGISLIDGVVCSAGMAALTPVVAGAPEEVERAFSVNVLGVWRTLKAVFPFMKAATSSAKRIVLVSSQSACMGYQPFCWPYQHTKCVVAGIAHTLRQELAAVDSKFHVSCFYPGAIDTPLGHSINAIGRTDFDPSADDWRLEARNISCKERRTAERDGEDPKLEARNSVCKERRTAERDGEDPKLEARNSVCKERRTAERDGEDPKLEARNSASKEQEGESLTAEKDDAFGAAARFSGALAAKLISVEGYASPRVVASDIAACLHSPRPRHAYHSGWSVLLYVMSWCPQVVSTAVVRMLFRGIASKPRESSTARLQEHFAKKSYY